MIVQLTQLTLFTILALLHRGQIFRAITQGIFFILCPSCISNKPLFFCRHMHFEHQPHTYAALLTLLRTHISVEYGGSLFLPEYGIRIQQATNSCIVWQPAKWHGTGVPNVDPTILEPDFKQLIAAFTTSKFLLTSWQKYCAGKMSNTAFNKHVEEVEAQAPYDH